MKPHVKPLYPSTTTSTDIERDWWDNWRKGESCQLFPQGGPVSIPNRFTNLAACSLFRLFSSLQLGIENNAFKISFDQSRHSGCECWHRTIPHSSKRRSTALSSLAFGAPWCSYFDANLRNPDLISSLYFTMSEANKQQQQGGFLAGMTGVFEGTMKTVGGAVGGVLER